jgi:hypothetical protein
VADRRPPAAERLIALAHEHFTLGHTISGEPYAVAKVGATTRRPFTGKGSLRSALTKMFNDTELRMPQSTALAAALAVLSEEAAAADLDPADKILADAAPDLLDGAAKASQATQLAEIAINNYTLGCTADGEPFAIPKDGPPTVRLLRGGRQSLRAELARTFYETTSTAASQSALADACMVVEGLAQRQEPAELHLRVAEHDGGLVLDLGDQTSRCVLITDAEWRVVDEPPVLFRRTALTGPLPEPNPDGTLDDDLWPQLNVTERYRPLVAAVLVAELMPRLPHPVVLLTGEQGTGKTTATARLASIIDPSPAQVRKQPRDVESWTTAAAGSWVVALDNLSSIPDWLSDALCRASTGDGDVRRRLYTDGDLHVIAFRRAPILNGIDVGAVRGDLADRLVHLALERIPDRRRRRDEVMAAEWQQAHPAALGALLNLAV